jgi:putative oxidoreductase
MKGYANLVLGIGQRSSLALLLLRLVVGLLFVDHALQKYGAGLSGFQGFLSSLGLPAPSLLAVLVPALELVGGLLVVAGLLTRPAALLLAVEMLGTGLWAKLHVSHLGIVDGSDTGAELDLAYLAVFITLVLVGPGRLSADRSLGLEAAEEHALVS